MATITIDESNKHLTLRTILKKNGITEDELTKAIYKCNPTEKNGIHLGTKVTEIVVKPTVTKLLPRCFADCMRLNNIIIPDSVVSIGREAFSHCHSVKKIVIPDSVKVIESQAFWYCPFVDEIHIGKGLKSIGDYAFANCFPTDVYVYRDISVIMELKPHTFGGKLQLRGCYLHVPKELINQYRTKPVWRDFDKILEL